MKLHTVLISIFLLGFSDHQANAQESEEIKPFKNIDYEVKLELGLTHIYDFDAELATMKGQLSPSLLGGISTNMNQWLSLQVGLAFQTYRLQSTDYTITLGTDIDPNTGLNQYASWVDYRVQAARLGVPIGLTLKTSQAASFSYLSARLKTLFAVGLENSKAILHESGLSQKEIEHPDFFSHPILFNPGAVIGYSWAASEDLNLLFEGFFDYCPSRIGETGWPRQSFLYYHFGATVGVRF